MLAVIILVLGALLLWMAVTGRLEQFWKAIQNPQGKPESA